MIAGGNMIESLTLAQSSEGIGPMLLVGIGVGLVLLLFLIVFLATRYKRCPSNRVLVIWGRGGGKQSARCYHGGGQFVWP